MSAITTYDGLIKRICDGYGFDVHVKGDWTTARGNMGTTGLQSVCRLTWPYTLPSLPSGVAGWRLATAQIKSSTGGGFLIVKQVYLGQLDISGASGTFTDGNAMPTVTGLGTSAQIYGGLFCEVSTAINATPGTFTVTWTDQGGNSRTSAAITPSNSAAVGSGGFVYLTGSQGVTDVTAAARSGGTSPTGIIKFYGFVVLAQTYAGANSSTGHNNLTWHFNNYLLVNGDDIAIFSTSSAAAMACNGKLGFIAEST